MNTYIHTYTYIHTHAQVGRARIYHSNLEVKASVARASACEIDGHYECRCVCLYVCMYFACGIDGHNERRYVCSYAICRHVHQTCMCVLCVCVFPISRSRHLLLVLPHVSSTAMMSAGMYVHISYVDMYIHVCTMCLCLCFCNLEVQAS